MEEINTNRIIILEKSVFNFRKIFTTISKKALFFTSLPFYWLLFFNYVLNWFDSRIFIFVVGVSIAMSLFGQGWGVIDWLVK